MEPIEVTVQIHAETKNAILVSEDGDEASAVWLPLSKIEVHETKKKEIIEVTMPEWLAKDKGLI